MGIQFHPYVPIGYNSVDLRCESGRIIKIESVELDDVPFDAYSIEVSEAEHEVLDEVQYGDRCLEVQLQVEHIEILRRAEWQEGEPPTYSTVGQNAVSINAGPVGSAPLSALSTTVVCGVVFRSGNPNSSSLLVYLYDFPGLVGFSLAKSEVDCFRFQVSGETLW